MKVPNESIDEEGKRIFIFFKCVRLAKLCARVETLLFSFGGLRKHVHHQSRTHELVVEKR